MFGFKTIVVGNMPNTKLAAAITAAKEHDGDKIDHTEIIRVYEWAWLGDWIEQVKELFDRSKAGESWDDLTASLQTIRECSYSGEWYDMPVIAGAEKADAFYLNIGACLESFHPSRTREHVAYWASFSLIDIGPESFGMTYAIFLTEETHAKQNSKLMLKELARVQSESSLGNGADMFRIRVFIVKKDGSLEMQKL